LKGLVRWQRRWQQVNFRRLGRLGKRLPSPPTEKPPTIGPISGATASMPFEDVPDFSGRSRLDPVRDFAIYESVEPLAGGENVGVIHETAATGVRPVPALSLRECRLIGFHVARERQKLPAPVNARTDTEHGELPVSDGNRLFHLPSPRGEFRGLSFAKLDNAGRSSCPGLAGRDSDPSELRGVVNLGGENRKAPEQLADGLLATLPVEDLE